MYRILAANQPVRERRNQREHPQYTKPELVATAPNQTWSWDIGQAVGADEVDVLRLYVVLDIFSRYAVGWMVADRENSALAGHSSKRPATNKASSPSPHPALRPLGADDEQVHRTTARRPRGDRSLSRPQVSDDNPFSRRSSRP